MIALEKPALNSRLRHHYVPAQEGIRYMPEYSLLVNLARLGEAQRAQKRLNYLLQNCPNRDYRTEQRWN